VKTSTVIDRINRKTMRASVEEYSAIVDEALNAAEQLALDSVAGRVRNKRILDIGVGAGRTVQPLLEVSKDYIGVDYVQEMVDHCRERFPGVRFEQSDARAMPQFADGSFDLIVFACNGICMVDHNGRLAILREVRRLLAPGGIFIFSTCNRNSPQYHARFRFPDFQPTRNPAKLAVRGLRFSLQTVYRLRNRVRFQRHEVKTAEYAILNDVCHHYQTMLYFISLAQQRRQLEGLGFKADARAYHLSGQLIDDDSNDGTLTLVAEKA
jgi:SAM-dependent methyltransferase